MSGYVKLKIPGMMDSDIRNYLVEVIVDMNYYLPAMFSILFKDTEKKIPKVHSLIDNMMSVKLGAAIEITFAAPKLGSDNIITNLLIKGEITSIEPIYNGSEVSLRIRGYDLGHRLTRGKATRTYGDGNPTGQGITDSDIVKKIAQNAGLSTSIDSSKISSIRYPYVMQYNQNDWDFLWARANSLGYQVYVTDKTLHFKPGGVPRSDVKPDEIKFQGNLRRFEPRIVSMGQPSGSEAYGWNPKDKKKINASAMTSGLKKKNSILGNSIPANIQVKNFKGSEKWIVIDPTMRETATATAVAAASFDRAASRFVQASGELTVGDPRIVSGTMLKISDLGVRFSGEYFATDVRHVWRRGQYELYFKASGQTPNTFRGLILGEEGMSKTHRQDGVVTAMVTSNQDPENLGRIQVKYPWLPTFNNAELSSSWARLAVPGGGKERGILFLPEIDDEVLVSFENGDMNYPYIIGILYNHKDKPAQGNAKLIDASAKKVVERVIVSRSGHKIIMDDTEGKEKITIHDKSKKNLLEFNSEKKTVSLKAEGDILIEAGGKISLKSKKDTTVDADEKITLKSKQDTAVDSGAKLTLKAQSSAQITATQSAEISANQKVSVKAGSASIELQVSKAKLEAPSIDISAMAQLALKGTAIVQIQGGIVKIN